MKTKLIALSVAVLGLSVCSHAQNKGGFGIRAGINFTNLNGKTAGGENLENKIKTGFNAGITADLPVGEEVSIQPGLLYTTKGAKADGTDNKVGISYLELPINFVYRPEVGTGHVLAGVGPYVAYALSGKVKPESGDDTDIEFANKISQLEAVSGTPYLKRFDAGINLLAGYEFVNKVSFQLNAGLGLTKLNPEVENVDDGKSSLKNTTFGVSIGYKF